MKLSIITINLNNATGLQKTIESVVSQTFDDYEYIVIDGGSTDGSVDVIKQYADKITYWVSEPDRGVYHAMNKGIAQAKGEYCLFLNSGDWILQNDGLQYVFDKNPVEDIIYCDAQHGDIIRNYADRLTLLTFFESSITHQATFIKKSLFSTFGLYNETYKIVSDWEFFLKTAVYGQCSHKHISFLFVYFDINGISYKNFTEVENERAKVIEKNFPVIYDVYMQFRPLQLLQDKMDYLNAAFTEMHYYRGSRLIQLIKKMQLSYFYQRIRGFYLKLKV